MAASSANIPKSFILRTEFKQATFIRSIITDLPSALNWMAVHPAHRRLGIGTLLMDIGVSLADKHDVEAWMEASSMGRPLYEQHGFRSLFKISFDTTRNGATDGWRRCEHEMTPAPFYPMWRPKRGIWEIEGASVRMPWDLGAEETKNRKDGKNGSC